MQWHLRLIALVWTLYTRVDARPHFQGQVISRSAALSQTYDYVIAGAGLSGLVVANRLSENPSTHQNTVDLLELEANCLRCRHDCSCH